MAKIDIVKLNDELKLKIVKHLKTIKGCFIGTPEFGKIGNGFYMIVETSEPWYVCDSVIVKISKSAHFTVSTFKTHEGTFDWKADTYIKDAAEINWKFG